MSAEEQAAAAAASAAAAANAAPATGEKPPAVEAHVFDKDGKPVLGKDGTPLDPTRLESTLERLRKDEGAAKKLSDLEAQKQKDEDERLRKQGEFEALHRKAEGERDTAVASLATVTQERDEAFKLLQDDADKRVAALPEAVRKMVPDAKTASPLERLAKIAELETLAAALTPPKNSPTAPLRGAVAAGNRSEGTQEQKQTRSVGVL